MYTPTGEGKKKALEDYKKAKEEYLAEQTPENWRKFCEKKIICKHYGVRI